MSNPRNLIELYSGDDVASLFKGGFINFGYWDKETIEKEKFSESDVIKANARLGYEVFKNLDVTANDKILEVGSGFGSISALLTSSYKVTSVVGMDYFEKHVEIARTRNKALMGKNKLNFINGKAEEIPFPDNSFNKVFNLEAFQHFNVRSSISEFGRVLTTGGRLVIATFFSKDKENFKEILKLLPRAAVLSDNDDESNSALPEVIKVLESSSFSNITVTAIGQHIWNGYDKWVKQREPGIWDTNWLIAYKKGLLDYFIITSDFNC